MMRAFGKLLRCREGAASVEFVLVAPIVVLFLVGFLQIGMLGMAKAGLGQAVEVGARYATIYPRPTDTQIYNKIRAGGYGMKTASMIGPTFTHGTSTTGSPYVDITMSYRQTLDFGFFNLGPVQVTHTRRAYQV
jgi:Flp pilus assembly protein TadG